MNYKSVDKCAIYISYFILGKVNYFSSAAATWSGREVGIKCTEWPRGGWKAAMMHAGIWRGGNGWEVGAKGGGEGRLYPAFGRVRLVL